MERLGQCTAWHIQALPRAVFWPEPWGLVSNHACDTTIYPSMSQFSCGNPIHENYIFPIEYMRLHWCFLLVSFIFRFLAPADKHWNSTLNRLWLLPSKYSTIQHIPNWWIKYFIWIISSTSYIQCSLKFNTNRNFICCCSQIFKFSRTFVWFFYQHSHYDFIRDFSSKIFN